MFGLWQPCLTLSRHHYWPRHGPMMGRSNPWRCSMRSSRFPTTKKWNEVGVPVALLFDLQHGGSHDSIDLWFASLRWYQTKCYSYWIGYQTLWLTTFHRDVWASCPPIFCISLATGKRLLQQLDKFTQLQHIDHTKYVRAIGMHALVAPKVQGRSCMPRLPWGWCMLSPVWPSTMSAYRGWCLYLHACKHDYWNWSIL